MTAGDDLAAVAIALGVHVSNMYRLLYRDLQPLEALKTEHEAEGHESPPIGKSVIIILHRQQLQGRFQTAIGTD